MGRYRALIISLTIVFYFILIALWVVVTDLLVLNLTVSAITFFLTMLSFYLERDFIEKFARSRFFIFHVNTIVRTFLLLMSLSLVNYLMFKHPWTFDFSKNGVSTLSAQTLAVLKKLPEPVKVIVFASAKKRESILSLLELYRYQKPNMTIEPIDPTLNPGMVQRYNITQDGMVVFEYKEKIDKSVIQSELNITNSLIKLGRSSEITVCWSQGHGELDLSNQKMGGGSFLKNLIFKSSYRIKTVEILKEGIPKSCSILSLMDPKSGFMQQEVLAIKNFLAHRGKLILGMGPDLNRDALANVREMLTDYGIRLNNDFVVDRTSYVSGTSGLVPLIRKLSKDSNITKQMEGNVFFPLVSSIDSYKAKKQGRVDILAQTTPYPSSWAEKSLQEMLTQKVTFNENIDMKGPITVALSWDALDEKKDRTKIVVVGNGAFLQNKYQKFIDNFTFYMNSLSWLSDEDQLQSFTDILLEKKNVIISGTLKNVLFYFSLFFAPMFFFAVSIFVYQRRKKL